jgi:hypothetical protein
LRAVILSDGILRTEQEDADRHASRPRAFAKGLISLGFLGWQIPPKG